MKIVKRCLLFATPALATTMLATSPSQAATFASSETTYRLDNFSHNPLDIRIITDAVTDAVSVRGRVSADANANADFNTFLDPATTFATNTASSTANGNGNEYLGFGRSFAQSLGFDFLIAAGETFTFDYSGLLNLFASVDNHAIESASADGLIEYQLFDKATGALLDFFQVARSITAWGDQNVLNSPRIASAAFNPRTTSDSFRTTVNRRYSRTFDNATSLRLVAFNASQSRVQAPEPGSILALLFCSGTVAVALKRKEKTPA
ncbi:MAG: hypothetical protein VKL59_10070 [Nostocaceae cyanobacterium]|nr:hypothetical protein [Nostocaceae cyanobacterium]